ncbi:unnamed protein product, partial [Phaeothamnion confervicola]
LKSTLITPLELLHLHTSSECRFTVFDVCLAGSRTFSSVSHGFEKSRGVEGPPLRPAKATTYALFVILLAPLLLGSDGRAVGSSTFFVRCPPRSPKGFKTSK